MSAAVSDRPALPAAPPPSAPDPRLAAARALTALGPAVLAVALAGALTGQEPFRTWFYCFAWWSTILFLDGCVYRRRKESLLLSHPRRFAFFAGLSVVMWLLFEALNFRLNNWSYEGVPQAAAARWAGYVLGFATVLPALMEMADLLDTAEIFREAHVKPLGWKRTYTAPLVGTGAALLALALLWPRVFFPGVWIAFVLILDPLNEKLGGASLLTDWREGSARRLQVLLLAGLLCGILWEAFNMAAGARWVYHLPGLDRFKLFEMPLPGYLGFPVFALEAFAFASLAVTLWEKASRPARAAAAVAGAALAAVLCGGVDRFTAGL